MVPAVENIRERVLRAASLLGADPSNQLIEHPVDTASRQLAESALHTLDETLSQTSTQVWIGLDGALRRRVWWRRPTATSGRLSNAVHLIRCTVYPTVSPATQTGVLASHPDGFVREAAVTRLRTYGPAALPWLLVRTVDWVEPVRQRAIRAVDELMVADAAEAFLAALPLTQHLHRTARADKGLADRIDSFLTSQGPLLRRVGLQHSDRLVRREVARRLAYAGPTDWIETALEDPDVAVRRRAAECLPSGEGEGAAQLRRSAFEHADGLVREWALRRMVEAGDATPFLYRGLEDSHRGVRWVASYALEQAGVHVRAYYEDAIQREDPSVGVVAGWAETGGLGLAPTDRELAWQWLVPVLDMDGPRARAAVRALAWLDADGTHELRLMMVDDPRPSVSRAAAASMRQLREADTPFVARCLSAPAPHVRRWGVALAGKLPGWAPACLLRAVDDAALEDRVTQVLGSWLQQRRATLKPPSADDRSRLEKPAARPDAEFEGALHHLLSHLSHLYP